MKYERLFGRLVKEKKIKFEKNGFEIEIIYEEYEKESVLKYVIKNGNNIILKSERIFNGKIDLPYPEKATIHNLIIRIFGDGKYIRLYAVPELLNFKSDEHILVKDDSFSIKRYKTRFLSLYINLKEGKEVLPRWITMRGLENIITNYRGAMKISTEKSS